MERREELLSNIERWEKELNEVWRDTNTDAAEVERRNLRNLIANARREIDEIDGNVQDSLEDIDPEKLLEDLKKEKDNIEISKNRLGLRIERLKEEREDYKDNKDLYEEYTKKISEIENELKQLEEKKEDREENDKNLRILTKGRMNEEKERRNIEKEIRRKQQEISEIEFDTENAMEKVDLSSGENVKHPKILRLYKELDALKSQLNQKDNKIKEYQDVIDELKGIDKETKKEDHELTPEEIRYYHGQGDLREYGGENGEDTRKNRLDNDEYFGLGKKPKDPKQPQPTPKDPKQPQPTPKDPKQPEPTDPDPKKRKSDPGVAIEKSGLQIFREQFNQMPEIKNRHTASERYAIMSPLAIPAAAASAAFIPGAGIPVAAGIVGASVIAKPIIYRATGQKKLEKEITKQFMEMDPNEFDRMVDYLSEERQADLLPNAVILNALNKAMLAKTKESKKRLDEELDSLKSERDQILEKGEDITQEEKDRLGEINGRIISISDYTTDSDGKRWPSESDIVSRRLKEIRRGKDRISARYKGNIGSRIFNIFNHRNSTTEEYSGPLNELADAEKARDIAAVKGDTELASKEQKNMEKVFEDNTLINGKGISKKVFNARKGAVRIISDTRDRTVQFVASILTAGVGLTKFGIEKANADRIQAANQQEFTKLQNQHNIDVNNLQQASGQINQKDIQSAADGQVTEIGTAREHSVLNNHGDFTQGYHSDDLQTQNIVNKAAQNSKVTGSTVGNKMHNLASIIREKASSATDLASSATNPAMSGNTLNAHSTLLGYEQNYAGQVNAEADIVDKSANVIDIVEKLKTNSAVLQNSSVSWTGPIIAAASGFIGKFRDAKRNRDIAKENKEIEENNEVKENDENGENTKNDEENELTI